MKLAILEPNGDALCGPDGEPIDPAELTVIALRTVWVNGVKPPRLDKYGNPTSNRVSSPGPNGESPDTGRWELLLPDEVGTWAHLGAPGTIYEGPTLSSSAMETYSECEAKWGYNRLDGEPKPPNRKAEMGQERHDELTDWLIKGKYPMTPGMDRVVQHFPVPGECESECLFGMIVGRPGHEVVISGYMDARELKPQRFDYVAPKSGSNIVDLYRNSDGVFVEANKALQARRVGIPVVRDLKTTGDFRWKKTGAQLRQHIQAAIYALDTMARVGCDQVILKWTYALIKEPGEIKRVETVNENDSLPDAQQCAGVLLTRAEALATVARYVVHHGEPMLAAIAGKLSASDLPQNIESCSMYGGCPWREKVCTVDRAGGGMFAFLKQERIRKKLQNGDEAPTIPRVGERPSEAVLSSPLGSRFAKALLAPPPPPPEEPALEERLQTELGARFASKLLKTPQRPATPTPNPSNTVNNMSTMDRFGPRPTTPAPRPPVPAAKPPAKSPTQIVAARSPTVPKPSTPSSGLQKAVTTVLSNPGGTVEHGFVTATPTPTPPPPPSPPTVEDEPKVSKVEVKAEVDGGASGVTASIVSAAATSGDELMSRLKSLAKLGGTASSESALEKAAAKTSTHPVPTGTIAQAKDAESNKLGALNVGINPADKAPEWTNDQQEAEARRLAGGGEPMSNTAAGLSALPGQSATGQTARDKEQAQLDEKAAKEAAKEAEKQRKAADKAAKDAEKARAKALKEQPEQQKLEAPKTPPPSTPGPFTVDAFMQGITDQAGAIVLLDALTERMMQLKERKVVAAIAKIVDEMLK